tara:strand:+ start:4784 stop:5203 length:420 start_codon:yes stop_codon:yes gene_type:complete
MIRYSLKCDQGHSFDSWFASAAAFDSLCAAGHVACAQCGSALVEKALMAPAVTPTGDEHPAPLTRLSPAQKELARLRREIEDKSEHVGDRFVAEARAIHAGDAPERPIWGEAKIADAKALLDDGVPVAPLPFVPRAKTN